MIEDDRIILRPIIQSDRDQILSLRLDFRANQAYLGFPYPINEINEEKWIADLYPQGQRKRIDFAIENKKDKAFLGIIGIKDLDSLHQRANFGIFIKREFWGKGYAKNAMMLFFRYLFEEIHLHRIILQVLNNNKRAIGLYESFGFKHEGILRQHHFQSGDFQDVLIMGLLRREVEEKFLKV